MAEKYKRCNKKCVDTQNPNDGEYHIESEKLPNNLLDAIDKNYIYLVHGFNFLKEIIRDHNGVHTFLNNGDIDKGIFIDIKKQLSLHFYQNDYVKPHGLGNWELHKYAIIYNAKDIKPYIFGLQPIDSLTFLNINIYSVESYIIIPDYEKSDFESMMLGKRIKNFPKIITYKRPDDEQLTNILNYSTPPNSIFILTELENEYVINNVNYYNIFNKELPIRPNKTSSVDDRYIINQLSGYELIRNGVDKALQQILNDREGYYITHNINNVYMNRNDECLCKINNINLFNDILHQITMVNGDGNILDESIFRKTIKEIVLSEYNDIIEVSFTKHVLQQLKKNFNEPIRNIKWDLTMFINFYKTIEYNIKIFNIFKTDYISKNPLPTSVVVEHQLNQIYRIIHDIFKEKIYNLQDHIIDIICEQANKCFDSSPIMDNNENELNDNLIEYVKILKKNNIPDFQVDDEKFRHKYLKYKNKYIHLKKIEKISETHLHRY